jgi:hypothetical protein
MALPIIDPVIFALVLTLTGPGAQPPPEPATAKFAVPRSKGRRPVDCCVHPGARPVRRPPFRASLCRCATAAGKDAEPCRSLLGFAQRFWR